MSANDQNIAADLELVETGALIDELFRRFKAVALAYLKDERTGDGERAFSAWSGGFTTAYGLTQRLLDDMRARSVDQTPNDDDEDDE